MLFGKIYANNRVRIDIKKTEMKDKRNFCKKCKTFIFETRKDGYINFPSNVISSDGMSITLKCKKCGEQITIFFK